MVYGQGAKVSHELQMRQGGKVQVRRPDSSALWLILCYLISRILILPQTGCNNTHWGTAILSSSACHYIPLIIIALPVHKIILAAQHLERHSRVNEQAFKVIPLQYAEYVNFSLQNFEKDPGLAWGVWEERPHFAAVFLHPNGFIWKWIDALVLL